MTLRGCETYDSQANYHFLATININIMSKENSAVPAVLTTTDIPQFLEKVNEQIKSIEQGMPSTPSTGTSELKGYGVISKISNVGLLIKAYASICMRKENYKKAKEALGIEGKKYPLSINGHGFSAWESDIKARIKYLTVKDELDKLNRIKKKLEDNLSAEQKLANDLKEIQNILTE